MDSKNLKRSKHHKKMKASTDNGNAEVFVLSPDILKKLGIQLGNESNSHGSDPDVAVAGVEIEKEPVNNYSMLNMSHSTDDTSILETASLMKKSVFLSPTFVTTVANVFPGEMEIANVVKERDAPIVATDIEAVNSDIFPVDVEITDTLSGSATVTETNLIINPAINGVFTVPNIEHHNGIEIIDSTFEDYKNITNSSCNNTVANNNPITTVGDNHVDGENVMNCGNSISKYTYASSHSTLLQAQKNMSKINIISEEIIGPSKLKGLKILPNITALTPVTIETNIGRNINDTAHKLIPISQELTECKPHGNEVLIMGDIPKVNSTENMLSKVNTVDYDVTQKYPEEKICVVAHNCDNNTSQVICNVVNPKVCSIKPVGNSKNTVNIEETCDSDLIPCYVENITETKESDIGELTSEVAIIKSFENNVYSDLNATVNKLQQNEILYADDIMEIDVDSKTLNVINTTYDVKQVDRSVEIFYNTNDPVVKLNVNSDSSNIQNSIIASPKKYCSESNNNNSSDNKRSHDFNENIPNKLEHHKEFAGETISHSCEVLYPNENDILMAAVDDNCKISKEKKGKLDILKQNNDRITSLDTMSNKMESSHDYQELNNKKETPKETNKCIENNLENNESILSNGTVVSDVLNDNSHSENSIQAKGGVLSSLNDTSDSNTFDAREVSLKVAGFDNCKNDIVNDTIRDANEHRNLDLEIDGNKNCIEHPKVLHCHTDSTKNEKYDHTKVSGSIHSVKKLNSQTIQNCDSIKYNGEFQQDNKKLIFLNMNNDSISSNTNTNLEKVKEIAEYLKTLTYNNSGKKKLETKKITKSNKHKSIEVNPNTIKSKLSIQGVEKPGGMTTNTSKRLNVLKTYQRPNRPKNKTIPLKNECYNAVCTVTDIYSEEKNTAVISADTKTQEFCLCDDFGRLDYYDCNDLYEHIHFRQQHNTNCDLDLIFNIYNDVVGDQKELNTEYITEEDTEKLELNICWNALHRELLDEDAEQNRIFKYANPNSLKFVKDNVNSCAKPNLIHNLDLKNPRIKDMEKGDVMPSADADIHESNLINLQDSQVSAPNENIDNSDLIRSENLNMDPKTVRVPKIEITYVKSEISSNNIEHDMEYFGENFMAENISFGTEISEAGESSVLDADVSADDTINDENAHSMNKNESTDGEEENLLQIKEKRIIQDRKKNTPISRQISNRNLKRRWECPRPRRNKCTNEPDNKKNIKCAVCGETFSSKKWESHVIGRHQFIAWRAGDDFDLDDADLQEKLTQSLKLNGYLKCTFCILNIYNLKKFIEHVRTCMQLKDGVEIQSSKSTQSNLICGVCQEEVQSSHWLEHIARQHNYLAWIDGVEPLNLGDESAVRDHMRQIVKQHGEVYCYKCNFGFKYPRMYLSHMESCNTVESAMPSSSKEEKPFFICGVCKALVLQLCWVEHIAKEHNYLAWQEGSLPLNLEDKDAVWNHLQEFIRHHGGLTCHKCGLNRKRVKTYLDHIKICEGRAMDSKNVSCMNDTNDSAVSDYLNTTDEKVIIVKVPPAPVETVVIKEKEHMTCGVCKQVVPSSQWIEHISKEHGYMAWEDGSPALDVNDEEAVRAHLYEIMKENNGLVCNKCGATRKYVKVYLEHIKECNERKDNSNLESVFGLDTITTESVICGTCKAEVKKEDWIQHMTTEHEYISWIEGQTPIDIENEEEVLQHLTSIHRVVHGFTCRRCGIVRKYPKKYMQHVKACKAYKPENIVIHNAIQNNELIECAICHEKMDPNDWKSHAMREHYNVAWVVGEPEYDINNPCALEPLLKEYEQKHKKMSCKRCGLVRLSRFGFYCHIWSCGKSEADLEQYKIKCEICSKEYLCIYKVTHAAAHRAEQKAERRLAAAPPPDPVPEQPVEVLSGRRRAAEKAKIVLKKYTKGVDEGCHRCPTCGYSTEIESELAEHVCAKRDGNYSDSDKSVNMDQWSDEESVDTDVDSNISDEDMVSPLQHKSHSRHSDGSSAARVQRLPFSVSNPQSYLKRSGKEFIEMYWSAEDLFPQWYSCEYEVLNEQEEAVYLPPIEESCKIRAVDKQHKWSTHRRFEASKRNQCIPIFVGAVIRCIAWAPSRVASDVSARERSYLAVACHLAHDAPRHVWDHAAHGPALIQIWDYGDMQGRPQLALCLALSGGAVWAADWCPSGTRAPLPECDTAPCRLGLLAVGCSDGVAYIFSVPYPSTIKQENKLYYKLKPVAKLKLTMSSDRKVYSATSLKWSPQKPHNHIIVGYSDGTIAYYDLNTESQILKVTEDNIAIFYPYYDERFLNGSVEGVDMYPTGSGAGAGAACGASVVGGGMARAGGGRRGAARLAPPSAAAAGAAFLPHWPSAVLFGDDVFMSSVVNEMEWWGGGRRIGGARAAAGCVRCGRAAHASQRLLRLYNAHPIEPLLKKLVVGVIEMVPLSNKRKRKQNDDLSMVLEPTTYEDAVKKYGLEYEIITGKDKVSQQKVTTVARPPFPERYPLAEMTSLAFCTAERHHDKLAVALHAGFVLIVSL